MSPFTRGETARILVQVSSAADAALLRLCPRCKTRRGFVSSGKFRVNAQKKRIDVWLIFRCTGCGDRWNWPVHERRPVGALDPAELGALMRNDPALAARHALDALRRNGSAGTPQSAVALTVLRPASLGTRAIEFTIAGSGLRLDRLLAQALALSRGEIDDLETAGAITVLPPMREALRRPARDGQRILIDLGVCGEELAARLCRRLASQPPDRYGATFSPR